MPLLTYNEISDFTFNQDGFINVLEKIEEKDSEEVLRENKTLITSFINEYALSRCDRVMKYTQTYGQEGVNVGSDLGFSLGTGVGAVCGGLISAGLGIGMFKSNSERSFSVGDVLIGAICFVAGTTVTAGVTMTAGAVLLGTGGGLAGGLYGLFSPAESTLSSEQLGKAKLIAERIDSIINLKIERKAYFQLLS